MDGRSWAPGESCVCVCMRVCCVCACVCVHLHVCVCVCVDHDWQQSMIAANESSLNTHRDSTQDRSCVSHYLSHRENNCSQADFSPVGKMLSSSLFCFEWDF